MRTRLTIYTLLTIAAVVIQGCEVGSTQESITFVNDTDEVIRVAEDGVEFTTLRPQERHAFSFSKSSTPSHIQAYSDGTLVHDGILVWNEVEANDFVYIIDESIESATATTTSQQ